MTQHVALALPLLYTSVNEQRVTESTHNGGKRYVVF